MSESKVRSTTFPALPDRESVDRFVREQSDTIHDPCGMAMGIALGMNESHEPGQQIVSVRGHLFG